MRARMRAARALATVVCALAMAGLAVLAGQPIPAAAAGTGWLRLAHLSPNTPAVDVYLYPFGSPRAMVVLRHVAYGTVSPYQRVASGDYTVAMRAAGRPASSRPVLSATVDVAAGKACTVAGMGPARALRLQVLRDRLTAPPGRALVRVIQAPLRQTRITPTIGRRAGARGLALAAATGYQAVAPGTSTVHATGLSEHGAARLTFAPGSIQTLVVLDDPGHLAVRVLEDAAGATAAPAGAPATGLGGTAARPGPSLRPWLAVTVCGLLMSLAGLTRLRGRPLAGR